ncbi:MAG: YraN family protein [Lachnospira sp.]
MDNIPNKRQIGTKYEEIACKYLIDKGYIIIETNFRCKLGEIDIIARIPADGTIVFCEVKYRKNNLYGTSLEAVNYKKQATIRKVASYYLIGQYKTTDVKCRFDVVGIDNDEIVHIENAF